MEHMEIFDYPGKLEHCASNAKKYMDTLETCRQISLLNLEARIKNLRETGKFTERQAKLLLDDGKQLLGIMRQTQLAAENLGNKLEIYLTSLENQLEKKTPGENADKEE